MSLLPLLADDFIGFLKDQPQVVVIVLVVIIGLIQGIARTAKKVMGATGMADQRGGMGGGNRRRQRDAVLDADPESLLPSGLRSRVWGEAKRAGIVEDAADADHDWYDDDDEEEEVKLEPIRARRAPAADAAPVARRVARRMAAPAGEDDQQSIPAGTTNTTHDDDVSMARWLITGRRPTRAEVRTAILWSEIIGPPRALKPYRSPARRGGSAGAGPTSIAIMPLRDRPRS
jgi:hypothetical protein